MKKINAKKWIAKWYETDNTFSKNVSKDIYFFDQIFRKIIFLKYLSSRLHLYKELS